MVVSGNSCHLVMIGTGNGCQMVVEVIGKIVLVVVDS